MSPPWMGGVGPGATMTAGSRGAGEAGGEGGIRTLEGVAPLTVFETARFNHSRTSPGVCLHELTGFAQGAPGGAGYRAGYRFASPKMTRPATPPANAISEVVRKPAAADL